MKSLLLWFIFQREAGDKCYSSWCFQKSVGKSIRMRLHGQNNYHWQSKSRTEIQLRLHHALDQILALSLELAVLWTTWRLPLPAVNRGWTRSQSHGSFKSRAQSENLHWRGLQPLMNLFSSDRLYGKRGCLTSSITCEHGTLQTSRAT